MLLLLSFWIVITKGMRIATTGDDVTDDESQMIVTNVDNLDCGDDDDDDNEDVTDDDNNKPP